MDRTSARRAATAGVLAIVVAACGSAATASPTSTAGTQSSPAASVSPTVSPTPTETPTASPAPVVTDSPTPVPTAAPTVGSTKCALILTQPPATEADTTFGRVQAVITEGNALLKKGKRVTYKQYHDAVFALYDPACTTYNPNMEAFLSQAKMTDLFYQIETGSDPDTIEGTKAFTVIDMSGIPGNYSTAVLAYVYGAGNTGPGARIFLNFLDGWVGQNQP
jgi:hypothetical protein